MGHGLGRLARVGSAWIESTRVSLMLVGLTVGLASGGALGCARGSDGVAADREGGPIAGAISPADRIVVGAGTASSPRFRARLRVAARRSAR